MSPEVDGNLVRDVFFDCSYSLTISYLGVLSLPGPSPPLPLLKTSPLLPSLDLPPFFSPSKAQSPALRPLQGGGCHQGSYTCSALWIALLLGNFKITFSCVQS